MGFSNGNDDLAFSSLFFSRFLFSSLERMIREKQQEKNKLISFFFRSLINTRQWLELPLSSMSTKAKKEEEEEKKNASYVSYYACVLHRARQLGNRNNTPFFSVLASPLSHSFFSSLLFFCSSH
jgi:hypothetical protein